MRNKDHPLYPRWKSMRSRCRNPNVPKYALYGARGVEVCQAWDNFAQFVKDVGLPPGPGYSLDRYPDMNGNYAPGNVRWANAVQQAENRRRRVDARLMTLDGVVRHQAEWGKLLGIGDTTISRRRELGWSDEKILTTPVDKRFNKMKKGVHGMP